MARRPPREPQWCPIHAILLTCPAASGCFLYRADCGDALAGDAGPGERVATEHGPLGPRAVSWFPLTRPR
jgi:hypothetical protein